MPKQEPPVVPVSIVAGLKAASDVAAEAEQKPKSPVVRKGDAKLWEFTSNRWCLPTVPIGTRAEDLDGDEAFWSQLADGDIREGDVISASCADRSWYCDFKVVYSELGVLVANIFSPVVGSARAAATNRPKPIPEGYRIERAAPDDPLGGYVARRARDDQPMARGADWQECYAALLDHAIFRAEKAARYLP